MREFKSISGLYDGNLALSIAPALTPKGIEENPLFFHGEIVSEFRNARRMLCFSLQTYALAIPYMSKKYDENIQ